MDIGLYWYKTVGLQFMQTGWIIRVGVGPLYISTAKIQPRP